MEHQEIKLTPKSSILSQINQCVLNTSPSVLPSLLARLKEAIDENPQVQNPIPAKNKRDKSLFEIVEDKLFGRKCGTCGEGGHNARTCK